MRKRKNWVERVKRSGVGLALAAMAAFVIWASEANEALNKVLIALDWKRDALDVAREDARGEFSRKLTRLMWQRVYWMRRVVFSAQLNMSPTDRLAIWNSYLQNLEVWNTELMVNILTLEDYYGTQKRYEFEGAIQSQFSALHSCLVSLGRPDLSYPCELSQSRDMRVLNAALDALNEHLYCFVSGFPRGSAESANAQDQRSCVRTRNGA